MMTSIKSKRFYSSKKQSNLIHTHIPDYIDRVNINNSRTELIQELQMNSNLVEQIRSQLENLNIDIQNNCTSTVENYDSDIDSDDDVITYYVNTIDTNRFNTISPKYRINDKVKIKTYYSSAINSVNIEWKTTSSYFFYKIIDILYSQEQQKHIYICIDEHQTPDDYYINGLNSKSILQKYEDELCIL